jgi:sulfur-carrier protein
MTDEAMTERPDIIVRLPAILVDLFPGAGRRVEMQAGTVAEMVDGLEALWPGMRGRPFAGISTCSWTGRG